MSFWLRLEAVKKYAMLSCSERTLAAVGATKFADNGKNKREGINEQEFQPVGFKKVAFNHNK